MDTLPDLALSHLKLRLRPINRALRAAVERQGRLAARLVRPDITPLCVTDDQVSILLDDMDALLGSGETNSIAAPLTTEEMRQQECLRAAAASNGLRLPLDELVESVELSPFEEEAILLCAAAELDRAYERIYAYILDDLNRRQPCIELLCTLTAASLEERSARRRAIGRCAKLRRYGLLRTRGEAASELRQEVALATGLLDVLTGQRIARLFRDPDEVRLPASCDIPPGVDREAIERLTRGLREGWISVAGIWGPRQSACDDVVLVVAACLDKPLRCVRHVDSEPGSGAARMQDAVEMASALGATLWINSEALNDPGAERISTIVSELLATATVPIVVSGRNPWRPSRLLSCRSYAEIELDVPDLTARQSMWMAAVPEADAEQVRDLAGRYRICSEDVTAAARYGRTRARLAGNGHAAALSDHLEAACSAVCRKTTPRFATVVRPKRGPEDLVLPRPLHDQVLEVADFFRAWPRVAEDWGFGRLQTGGGGIKALFTGDSGTGKTLASEVIAGRLHMPLLKIDLAQVISKWVGETEKHLEGAFQEAEDSHAVLFFDEADALFGRRGEVQHGVDRYSNLEVSYLLQRLEAFGGLVILASNLKDNIDCAFARRFQVVLHFPRPGVVERRRIWEIALPPGVPWREDLNLDVLAGLDLTGAGIVNAASTAALLAAASNSPVITKPHLLQAIARQYRREARVLSPSELGAYAVHLRDLR